MITRGNINLGFIVALGLLIWAFFLPWLQVEASFLNKLAKITSGRQKVVLHSLSGFDIPKAANSKDAKVITQVSQIFVKSSGKIGIKSYAVYAIPFWGMLMFWIFLWAENKRWGNMLIVVFSWAFSGSLAMKILITNTDVILAKINFSYGFWLSIGAIAFMGLCASFKVVVDK
jgi:hypothetical protein